MSTARWAGFSLLGLLVLTLCGVLVLMATDQPEGAQDRQQKAERAQRDYCATLLRSFQLNDGAAPNESPSDKSANKREQADLCQQIRMADSAKWSADIALVQLMLGVLTLIGLWVTVRLTAKAANAAAVASTVAASALDVQVKSERPLLYIQSIVVSTAEPVWRMIQTEIVNLGKTPAVLSAFSIEAMALPVRGMPSPKYKNATDVRGTVMRSDETVKLPVYMEDNLEDHMNNGGDVILLDSSSMRTYLGVFARPVLDIGVQPISWRLQLTVTP